MIFNSRKHNRPLIFWYTVRNVFWARSSLCLNNKGLLDFL